MNRGSPAATLPTIGVEAKAAPCMADELQHARTLCYNISMRAKQAYWQNYWYDLRFRSAREPSFEPMGPGGPQQLSNKGLATASLEEIVERFLEECVDELDDLRGELQLLVYTEATPGPDTKPVMVRTVTLGRR